MRDAQDTNLILFLFPEKFSKQLGLGVDVPYGSVAA